MVSGDVSLRPADHGRLAFGALRRQLVGDERKMFPEDFQETDCRLILPRIKHFGVEISVLQTLQVDLRAPLQNFLRNTPEPGLGRLSQRDLTRDQKANDPLTELDRYGRVAETGKAGHSGRMIRRSIHGFLLKFEARCAGTIGLGQQRAERVLVRSILVWQLPKLDWPKPQRQFSACFESSLVFR